MRDLKRTTRGGAMLEFTLLIPVWLPLLLGTMWIGTAMIRGLQVTQVARDLASMFCRAVDFSDPTNAGSNYMLTKITQELGPVTAAGTGVVIFSTLTYVGDSVCTSAGPAYHDSASKHTAACTNYSHFVFTQRYTVGNTTLRSSNFGGTLATADTDSTQQYKIPVTSYVTHAADQANGFTLLPKPLETGTDGYQSGQPVYVVEVFFSGAGQVGYTQGGSYAYAIF
jgi:Flp pilus assembly protein TadG